MIVCLANIDIKTPTTPTQQLHNIPCLLHNNKPARKQFTHQIIATLDRVLTAVTVENPSKGQGNSTRSHQPPPKRQREHAAHKRTQPHTIQQLLSCLAERGLWNITDLHKSMNIQRNDSLLTHLKLPPNTCLKLTIQGECMYTACPRLHPTNIGTFDTTRLAIGLTALIASDFFDHTWCPCS